MRRADISINVLIMAVVGLIVLVILVALFTGKIRIFGSNIEPSCKQQGGDCIAPTGKCEEPKPIRKLAQGCSPTGGDNDKEIGTCCIPQR